MTPTVAMVFWLVFFGTGNGTSQTIIPVPFEAKDDCEVAGQAYNKALAGAYGAYWFCAPQSREDVNDWLRANAGRFTYGDSAS